MIASDEADVGACGLQALCKADKCAAVVGVAVFEYEADGRAVDSSSDVEYGAHRVDIYAHASMSGVPESAVSAHPNVKKPDALHDSPVYGTRSLASPNECDKSAYEIGGRVSCKGVMQPDHRLVHCL